MRHVVLTAAALWGLSGCAGELSEADVSPIASAGFDQVRYLGDDNTVRVPLDGRASCDPLGGALDAYHWTIIAAPPGSEVEVQAPGEDDNPRRAAFQAELPGTYLVALRVGAGQRVSTSDTVAIEVRVGDDAPQIFEPPLTDLCGTPIE